MHEYVGYATWYSVSINVCNIKPQRGKIWKLRKTFQVCDKNCSPVDSKKSCKVGFFWQGARIWLSLFVSAWMSCFLFVFVYFKPSEKARSGLVMILARLESWSLARVSPPVTTFQLDPCSSFCQPVEYNFKVLYKCTICSSNDVFHTKLLDYCCSTLITQVERVKNNVHGNQHVSRVQNKVQNIVQFALCSALPWWAVLK